MGWTPALRDKCYIKDGRYPGEVDKIDPNKKKPIHVTYKVTAKDFNNQTLSATNQGWFSRSDLEKRTA